MRYDHRMDRASAKRVRAKKVSKIVVEVDGIPFDGDEDSQARMAGQEQSSVWFVREERRTQ